KVASLVGVPTLVLLAGLFAWRAVRRALAPVDAMTAEVDEIQAHALDHRLAAPAGDDEIARLARTLNHMLDSLATAAPLQRGHARLPRPPPPARAAVVAAGRAARPRPRHPGRPQPAGQRRSPRPLVDRGRDRLGRRRRLGAGHQRRPARPGRAPGPHLRAVRP